MRWLEVVATVEAEAKRRGIALSDLDFGIGIDGDAWDAHEVDIDIRINSVVIACPPDLADYLIADDFL